MLEVVRDRTGLSAELPRMNARIEHILTKLGLPVEERSALAITLLDGFEGRRRFFPLRKLGERKFRTRQAVLRAELIKAVSGRSKSTPEALWRLVVEILPDARQKSAKAFSWYFERSSLCSRRFSNRDVSGNRMD